MDAVATLAVVTLAVVTLGCCRHLQSSFALPKNTTTKIEWF